MTDKRDNEDGTWRWFAFLSLALLAGLVHAHLVVHAFLQRGGTP